MALTNEEILDAIASKTIKASELALILRRSLTAAC
jgi:hypothetical protein